jgi:hypothetical protein
MPAILETDSEVTAWLDSSNVPLHDALKLLKPKPCLKWYPVSKLVNNSRYQDKNCREEIPPEEIHKSPSKKKLPESKTMMKWLTASKNSPTSPKTITPSKKRKQSQKSIDKWMVKKQKK